MSILVFSALFFPVVLSGLSIFFFKTSGRVLKLILAFSGAFLLTISFVDILPEIYTVESKNIIGIFILIGFFIQLLLDFITKGVEHGHEHEDIHHHHTSFPSVLPILIGVCLHSFLEGMPLAQNFGAAEFQQTLLIGIVIHNIPISLVLMGLLIHSNTKKTAAVIQLLIFALSAPLGTFLCNYFGSSFINNLNLYYDIVMAMVVGIFLHISTTILFESDEKHGFNLFKFIAIILGVGIAFLNA